MRSDSEVPMTKPSIFSPEQLAKIVNETIPSELPNGHTNAIVGAVDQTGAKVVASFSLDQKQRWQLRGAWDHEWESGNDTVGGQVLVSWGAK